VLRSGHHAEVASWRRRAALRRTYERRPDLLAEAPMAAKERAEIERWRAALNGDESADAP